MEKKQQYGNGTNRDFSKRENTDSYNTRREGGNYERKPRYNRSDDGEERPRFTRDTNTYRPRYNNDGEERPRYNRDQNSGYRPRYNRNDNNEGEERPRYNRDQNSGYRPRYNRNDNNEGEERPRFNRNQGGNRPRFNRNDNNSEQRPRFNKQGGGYGQRPRFNKPGGYNRNQGPRKPAFKKPSLMVDSLFCEEIDETATFTPASSVVASSDKMRLNRYIAMAGVCSRREADELIKKGLIKLNGEVVTEMGITITKDDKVEYDGRVLVAEKKVYVLLNKPKDTVTTTDDPEERRTVMDLVTDACEERIYPVGRLDRNTTGLLLMTNDGDLTEKLMHPRYGVSKIYHVYLDRNVSEFDMRAMLKGIHLEDGDIQVDDVRYVDSADHTQVGIQIHSGRNRIVRRIFEHLGYNVEKLDRVYFAGLTKLNLPRGRWRYLTDSELSKLKAGFFK